MSHRLKLIAFLARQLLRLLSFTWRVRLCGPEPPYVTQPVVFCFLHGQQAALLRHPRPRTVAVLASRSRDGALQTAILAGLGFRVARGSSSKGGAAGLKALTAAVREGCDAALAVDGPRGPYGVVKPGALWLARVTGAALVPIVPRASSAWIFAEAWDRYELPKPFARIELHRGAPIPAQEGDPDAVLASLEEALHGRGGSQYK